ncbi:hypothetical protein VPH35_066396 [Triticum aestivum]
MCIRMCCRFVFLLVLCPTPDWTMNGVMNTKQPESAVGDGVEVCKEPSRTKTSPGRTSQHVDRSICLLACEEENTQIQNFNNKGGRFAQAVYISRELRGRTAGRLSFSHSTRRCGWSKIKF